MADLPRPNKNKKTVNTDNEDTVVIKVDESQYNKRNLDNVNTAKITNIRNNQGQHRQNFQSYGSQQVPKYTGPRATTQNNRQSRPQQNNHNASYGNGNVQGNSNNRQNYNYNNHNNQNNKNPQRTNQRPPQRQYQNQRTNSTPRKKKRSGTGLKILKTVLIIVVAIFVVYSVIVLLCIARMNHTDSGERSRTAGAMTSSKVTNVLVIGTDSRDPTEERGRSDSMILVSLNSKTHKIYMTSFMRDAYVSIPGYGDEKLNAAYSYGGADLLMDTIESNYDIKIDSYVSITFEGFAGIIDSVGGVTITLSDAEAEALNVILQSEVNEIMGDDVNDDLLSGGGTYKLDGKQALSYSRIRYTGNADFERTQRQRSVMDQVLKKAKSLNPVYITSLFSKSIPQLTTNMSTSELYLLSLRLPTLLVYSTQQQQIPADGTWSNGTANGQDVLKVDFEANRQLLQDTIFAG